MSQDQVSPLAPASFPDMAEIKGVRFATCAAGVRYQGRTDVMLAVCDPGSCVAGVFTRSNTRSAPVLDCQSKLGGNPSEAAAILVNSGNANAFTGRHGEGSVEAICKAVAEAANIPEARVFTSSTGVIGERLAHDRIVDRLEDLTGALGQASFEDAAKAIMTTDTYAKGASAEIMMDGKPVRISGIAKGSGMIAPDMATMLVYIFTDAKISQGDLQALLTAHTDTTFNCITVDSDTSTSDTLLCVATGASGVDVTVDVTGNDAFADALRDVMMDLAHQVVRDGEGATKFVEIAVTGAASQSDAHIHAMAIANSPLVKTAIAGEDPNWGRIVMAIGKSGATADRDLLSISFGETLVAEKGWVAQSYVEADCAQYMKGDHIRIAVDLGLGGGMSTVWTCDLTHRYIEINADYRS